MNKMKLIESLAKDLSELETLKSNATAINTKWYYEGKVDGLKETIRSIQLYLDD